MSGTVNISRDIWADKAFKPEPFTEREAFIWMIMEASYKPRSKPVGKIWVDTERGQLACSVRFMCEAWGWSKSKVDRFLKRLENRDMIGTDSGTGVNLITICKYDEYQNKPNFAGQQENEKRDSSGTAAGQQRDKPNKGLIPDVIQGKEEPLVPSKKGARLPENWTLPKHYGEWALDEGWSEQVIRLEADKFRDFWISKSGKDAAKLDWLAVWRNWMRNSKSPKIINGGLNDRNSQIQKGRDQALADEILDAARTR